MLTYAGAVLQGAPEGRRQAPNFYYIAYVCIRLHTSAYVSKRHHESAYVSIRQNTSGRQAPLVLFCIEYVIAIVSIRQEGKRPFSPVYCLINRMQTFAQSMHACIDSPLSPSFSVRVLLHLSGFSPSPSLSVRHDHRPYSSRRAQIHQFALFHVSPSNLNDDFPMNR